MCPLSILLFRIRKTISSGIRLFSQKKFPFKKSRKSKNALTFPPSLCSSRKDIISSPFRRDMSFMKSIVWSALRICATRSRFSWTITYDCSVITCDNMDWFSSIKSPVSGVIFVSDNHPFLTINTGNVVIEFLYCTETSSKIKKNLPKNLTYKFISI